MLSIAYETFYEVACHLSFSKAADVMCVSQPAVSKQVKKLEGELGVRLFERQGNTIRLSPPGEKLLTQLRQARQIEKQIESDIDIVKTQQEARGELRIGASTTLSLYVLPKVLSSFRRKWPQTKITLINRNTENVLKSLVKEEIDLAIVEDKHESNALHYDFFMADTIIPVCSNHSPFAGQKIRLDELMSVPLVIREVGSGTLSAWSRKLNELKVKIGNLNIVARLGGTEALKNFLVEDTAIGFLSPWAIKRELEMGLLKEVDIPDLNVQRSFNFVIRTGETPAGTTKAFVSEAKLIYN
ncbi:LysR substrate-binding domain-containing protein [Roseivirga sp. E12]|uniref:LysR substrate-binding domain-containing protein n=1 Tax=Roseivirga sp. E12 TaxID=2819237 RepID=UPI001ABBFD31|nr:LysR substrate-binding domain-containing protein [Roseivirga sp. E12]MBO3699473.1 LysR family transcriptional regulator [Roseivirga sp. E12]